MHFRPFPFFILIALSGCDGPRAAGDAPAEARDAARQAAVVRAQLSQFARPAPNDPLAIHVGATAAEPVRVEREGQPGVELTITAEGVADVALRATDDATKVALDVADGTDLLRVVERGRFEELRHVRRAAASIDLAYRIALGPSLATLRVVGDRVEALDGDGVARLRSEPSFAADASGVRRALAVTVDALFARTYRITYHLDARDLAPPIAIDPAWTSTGSLPVSQGGMQAFTLPGNKVMALGGVLAGPETEVWDAATGSWTSGPPMSQPRQNVPAVVLSDGRVFVPGGVGGTDSPPTGDLYSPSTGTWKKTTAAPAGYGPVIGSAPLADGARALVVGLAGASIYDATKDSWVMTTGAMITPRRFSRSVLLASGKVLVAGGSDASGNALASAELYDPATGTFSAAGAMSSPRLKFTLNRLGGGKVVAVGGNDGSAVIDTVDVFDPTTATWSAGPKLSVKRVSHAGIVLADGRLLIAGGDGDGLLHRSSEILDAAATSWISSGSMMRARESFPLAFVAPASTKVLAVGGYDGAYLAESEVFDPLANGQPCAGPGECAGSACVDGYCCEKSACASGETCGGSAAPGRCTKTLGQSCAAANECGSGVCVDGVCCDRACDGSCEACDTKATPGRCTTLAPGESPHGSARAKCPGSGVCTGLCGGVDPKSCTIFPGAATSCGEAACADGAESPASFCDGAGACAAVTPSKCEPFVCGATSCKKACAVDADCAAGYSCDARTGHCVFGAKCDGEHTVLVPGQPSIDCTPYRCAGASCLGKCATSDDCIGGTTCDTAAGQCVSQAAPSDSGGGCAFGRRQTGGAALVLLMLGALRRRRRVRLSSSGGRP